MYNEVPCELTSPSQMQIKQPDIIEKLEGEQKILKQRLAEVEEALAALKSNPELEKVFRLVSKVSFRL